MREGALRARQTSGETVMLRSIAALALLFGLYACTTAGDSGGGSGGQVENHGGSGGGGGY
jgi:hypothetical protein